MRGKALLLLFGVMALLVAAPDGCGQAQAQTKNGLNRAKAAHGKLLSKWLAGESVERCVQEGFSSVNVAEPPRYFSRAWVHWSYCVNVAVDMANAWAGAHPEEATAGQPVVLDQPNAEMSARWNVVSPMYPSLYVFPDRGTLPAGHYDVRISWLTADDAETLASPTDEHVPAQGALMVCPGEQDNQAGAKRMIVYAGRTGERLSLQGSVAAGTCMVLAKPLDVEWEPSR